MVCGSADIWARDEAKRLPQELVIHRNDFLSGTRESYVPASIPTLS
jgi:hypothetical protein